MLGKYHIHYFIGFTMNTIIKILVFITIFTGALAQDTIERIPSSMEQIDTVVEATGTNYSQLFGDNFDTEYDTELFDEKTYYGFSFMEYEHYSGKSHTVKISYRNQTSRRFMFGYNGGFFYVPNKYADVISYAVPYVSCGATWLPVITDKFDIAIDFEGGMSYSMNYFMGTNKVAPYISIGAGTDVHLTDNSIVTIRSSLGIIATENTTHLANQTGFKNINFTTGQSGVPFFSLSIGILLSEIKYKQ